MYVYAFVYLSSIYYTATADDTSIQEFCQDILEGTQ